MAMLIITKDIGKCYAKCALEEMQSQRIMALLPVDEMFESVVWVAMLVIMKVTGKRDIKCSPKQSVSSKILKRRRASSSSAARGTRGWNLTQQPLICLQAMQLRNGC